MTRQGQLIYDIIFNSSEHLAADDIFVLAKKTIPSISFGTVYRNLAAMVSNGDIAKLEFPNEPARFDKITLPHSHIKCIKCGKIEDIIIDGLDEIIKKNILNVIDYNLHINYICEDCSKKNM